MGDATEKKAFLVKMSTGREERFDLPKRATVAARRWIMAVRTVSDTGTRDRVINYYRVDKECRWGPMIGGLRVSEDAASVVIDRLIDSFLGVIPPDIHVGD